MKNHDILSSREGFTMRHVSASLLSIFLAVMIAMPLCFAGTYDFKEMTPAIEQALKNRQTRYQLLQSLKQEGAVGENNTGYVTNLKDNAKAIALTADENRDRRVIYEALAKQNALGNTGLLEVQRAFAEVQSEKAGTGDMIQSSSGDWKKKS